MMKRLFSTWLALLLCMAMLASVILSSCAKEEPGAGEESSETETETETQLETESETDLAALLVDFDCVKSGDEYTITGVKDRTKTTYTIPDFITAIGADAFKDCTALTALTIPDSVTSIASTAFAGCEALIQKENGLSYVDRWVIDCDTSVRIAVWKTGTVGIADSAFEGCSYLQTLTIPDSVQHIGFYAFDGCSSVGTATVPATALISLPKAALRTVTVTGGTNIEKYAFASCKNLTTVNLPDGITHIGEYAFDGCSSLTTVNLPDSVATMGIYVFQNCTALKSLTLPIGLTAIPSQAFYGCGNLESISIPTGVKSIGIQAFDGCNKIGKIEDGVHYIGNWVVGCLRNVETLSVKAGTVGIMDEALRDRTNLKTVKLPEGMKYLGHYAFYDCRNLANLTLPEGLVTIGYQAFNGCINLRKAAVKIPSTVKTLDVESFGGATLLLTPNRYQMVYVDRWIVDCDTKVEYVVVQKNTVGIGLKAFDGCRSLKTVYFEGTPEEWSKIIVNSGNDLLSSVTVCYLSKTQPTEAGNYWHFDETDIYKPVRW